MQRPSKPTGSLGEATGTATAPVDPLVLADLPTPAGRTFETKMLVETGSLDGGDLYRDQGGASDTGTLLDGDDTVGPARLRRIRRASNQLQLFDAPDTTDLGAQFDTGGPAVAGRVHLKTATEEEVFEVADVTPSGQSGNRIRFGSLPTAFVDLLNGRVTGDRFILAISNLDIITRAGDAEAVEGTGALGEAAGTVGAADTRTGDAEAIEGTGELGEAEGAVGEAATRTGDAETIEARTGSLGEATGAAGAAPARTGDAEAIGKPPVLGEATGTAASAGERTGDAEAIEGTGELGEAEGAVGEAATRTGDAEAIEATGALGEAAGTSTAPGERTGDAGAIEGTGSIGEATGAVGAAPARTGDAEAVEGVGSLGEATGTATAPVDPLVLADSDDAGLEVDCKALLVASDDATSGNFFYEDADRGGTDTPLDGELGLGDDDTVISGIRRRTANPPPTERRQQPGSARHRGLLLRRWGRGGPDDLPSNARRRSQLPRGCHFQPSRPGSVHATGRRANAARQPRERRPLDLQDGASGDGHAGR